MQALLAIPERDRTDAQWDELNELEISFASGNRQDGPEHGGGRQHHPQQNRGQQRQGGGGQGQEGKKPFRKFHKR